MWNLVDINTIILWKVYLILLLNLNMNLLAGSRVTLCWTSLSLVHFSSVSVNFVNTWSLYLDLYHELYFSRFFSLCLHHSLCTQTLHQVLHLLLKIVPPEYPAGKWALHAMAIPENFKFNCTWFFKKFKNKEIKRFKHTTFLTVRDFKIDVYQFTWSVKCKSLVDGSSSCN